MKPAVRIHNVSKRYRLGELHHSTIGDQIAALFKRGGRPANGRGRKNPNGTETLDEIWALKDVSFDVSPGEVVGIIGRNGAGKSTLLKILSRITEPTAGEIELRGRVSSLLEVGTGFHPELTGRDNVYLNGSVLGMKKAEIDRKFDEIVDFSGVERFLDTPVKHYSSGMQVRLAFAVAAHLEPEILIVDEVLAVGDAEFQRKCVGKMGEVATGGRTVLFVSHNMAAVENLCPRAILLETGFARRDGPTGDVIKRYLLTDRNPSEKQDTCSALAAMENEQLVIRLRLLDRDGIERKAFKIWEDMKIELQIESHRLVAQALVQIVVRDTFNAAIFSLRTDFQSSQKLVFNGLSHVTCTISECPLVPGTYSVDLSVWSSKDLVARRDRFLFFEVLEADVYGTGKVLSRKYGVVAPRVTWELPEIPSVVMSRSTAQPV